MGKAFAASIFVFCLCGAALAADLDLAKQLTTRYKGEVLSLRHPLIAERQTYGQDGEPLTGAAEGPWTLFGRIRIEQIVTAGSELRTKAIRVFCEFDKNGLKQMHDKDERVTITVRLAHPLASEDEAIGIFGRVFALTPKDIVDSVPDYWRDYLNKNMFGPPAPKEPSHKLADASKNQPASSSGTGAEETSTEAKEKVYRLDDPNVKAPKPTYAPEPQFTEWARRIHYDGVVGLQVIVDKAGRIKDPKIVHPLGMGLDESAIATVRQWKFVPGTRDGQPVEVTVYVEVDYHLYKR